MGLVSPEKLTDDELREDLESAKRMSADILSSNSVSQAVKTELEQHVRGLVKEWEKRTGEMPFSLSELGISE